MPASSPDPSVGLAIRSRHRRDEEAGGKEDRLPEARPPGGRALYVRLTYNRAGRWRLTLGVASMSSRLLAKVGGWRLADVVFRGLDAAGSRIRPQARISALPRAPPYARRLVGGAPAGGPSGHVTAPTRNQALSASQPRLPLLQPLLQPLRLATSSRLLSSHTSHASSMIPFSLPQPPPCRERAEPGAGGDAGPRPCPLPRGQSSERSPEPTGRAKQRSHGCFSPSPVPRPHYAQYHPIAIRLLTVTQLFSLISGTSAISDPKAGREATSVPPSPSSTVTLTVPSCGLPLGWRLKTPFFTSVCHAILYALPYPEPLFSRFPAIAVNVTMTAKSDGLPVKLGLFYESPGKATVVPQPSSLHVACPWRLYSADKVILYISTATYIYNFLMSNSSHLNRALNLGHLSWLQAGCRFGFGRHSVACALHFASLTVYIFHS